MDPIRGEHVNWPPVLVVDDCRMTRRLLSMYLRAGGFDVIAAENGVEGLEMLGREHCGLVVTDLNMPQMDGIELTSEMKAHPLCQDIPVIMLTTQGEQQDRQSGLDAGVAAFLTKPISQDELMQEIERVWPRDVRNLESSSIGAERQEIMNEGGDKWLI